METRTNTYSLSDPGESPIPPPSNPHFQSQAWIFLPASVQGPGVAAKLSNEMLQRQAEGDSRVVQLALPAPLEVTGDTFLWALGHLQRSKTQVELPKAQAEWTDLFTLWLSLLSWPHKATFLGVGN